jgi:aldose 1-epimerase
MTHTSHAHPKAQLHWLQEADQRLALCPAVGGSVAAWQWVRGHEVIDLWRPLRTGQSAAQPAHVHDMACFPLVPWSNRIGGGGFIHDGDFHALKPNTSNDPYPIHGDGWQRAWALQSVGPNRARLSLLSREQSAPHHYRATQTLALAGQQLRHSLTVQNLGPHTLPFGVGLHPWLISTPQANVKATVQGLWHSNSQRLPTRWSATFPEGWNLNQGVRPADVSIDHAYTGWSGVASVHWPEWGVRLQVHAEWVVSHQFTPAVHKPLSLVFYAPDQADVFCLEPVSHPINAPHLPGKPGWVALAPGDSMSLHLCWAYSSCT